MPSHACVRIPAPVKILVLLFLPAQLLLLQARGQADNQPPAGNQQQKPPANPLELWFNSSGQLVSYPPELVKLGTPLEGVLTLDNNFWLKSINGVLSTWIKTIEKLKAPILPGSIPDYGISDAERKAVNEELAYKIRKFLDDTKYLNDEIKKYYRQKLDLLGFPAVNDAPETTYAPDLDDLIAPEFTLELSFFDKNSARITSDGKPYCNGPADILIFQPCQAGQQSAKYTTPPKDIPPGCYEIRYELREKDKQNAVIQAWSNKVPFPGDSYAQIVKGVLDAFGDDYSKKIDQINDDFKKLGSNNADPSVDFTADTNFINTSLANIKIPLGTITNNDGLKTWIEHWYWLTNGVPQINPFTDAQGTIAGGNAAKKVSPQDKALYQIFDNMVTKGTIKISDLSEIDSEFKNIPPIKAALDAEAAQQTNEPQQSDRLMYQGILKPTSGRGAVYMRHLDALNNYIIMGPHPKQEITDTDRMYVLVENKAVPLKLLGTFTATTIGDDASALAIEIGHTPTSNADVAKQNPPKEIKGKDAKARQRAIKQYQNKLTELTKEVTALHALSLAPVLPLSYEKDQTPDLITFNVVHDFLADPPALVAYTVTQTNTDNTTKNVATGSYRVNKLYRFRLKAGLVYSFLKKTTYTQTSANHYTVDDTRWGIDGTFGIQAFFNKQDIRSEDCAWRFFVYAGFSMKKVTENFYPGLGVEPISGLAISLNAHIGKRQALVGSNNIPLAIKDIWGVNLAPSILIDPALFVKLFTFGNTNKSLFSF